jgi:hypothetical protein
MREKQKPGGLSDRQRERLIRRLSKAGAARTDPLCALDRLMSGKAGPPPRDLHALTDGELVELALRYGLALETGR